MALCLGTSAPDDSIFRFAIGKRLDPTLVPGLEAPLEAALAGDTDPGRLYTVLKPNEQYVMAAPIFSHAFGDGSELVGVMVVIFDALPTQRDIPAHILRVAGISLVVFLLGVGIMGAIFGAFFAHGLTTRSADLRCHRSVERQRFLKIHRQHDGRRDYPNCPAFEQYGRTTKDPAAQATRYGRL